MQTVRVRGEMMKNKCVMHQNNSPIWIEGEIKKEKRKQMRVFGGYPMKLHRCGRVPDPYRPLGTS